MACVTPTARDVDVADGVVEGNGHVLDECLDEWIAHLKHVRRWIDDGWEDVVIQYSAAGLGNWILALHAIGLDAAADNGDQLDQWSWSCPEFVVSSGPPRF